MRKTPTGGTAYWSRVSVRYFQNRGRESREREHLRKMVTITTRMADAGFDMLLLWVGCEVWEYKLRMYRIWRISSALDSRGHK